jgi:hypothetical protein
MLSPRKLCTRLNTMFFCGNNWCAAVGMCRVPSCKYVDFFPTSRQCQPRASSVRVRVYKQQATHCYFLRNCHLVTQIESFSAAFSSGGSVNNRKEPCQESRMPVEILNQFRHKFRGHSSQEQIIYKNGMYRTSAYPHFPRKFSDGDTTILLDQSPHLVNELVISVC